MIKTNDMDQIDQRVAGIGLMDSNGNVLPPDIYLDIQLTSSLPIFISKGTIIDDTTIRTVESVVATDLVSAKLTDPEWKLKYGEERYIFVSSVQSPLTKNIQEIYYDKKYQDLFMIGDLSFYNNNDRALPSGQYASATATRLGCCAKDGSGNYLDNFLPAPGSAQGRDFRLTKPALENITIKSRLCTLNGIDVDSKNRGIKILTKLPEIGGGLLRGDITPLTIIELGTMETLFGSNFAMPLFYVYQLSHEKFQVNYAGFADPKQNKLYIAMKI